MTINLPIRNSDRVVIIDEIDADEIAPFTWCLAGAYAIGTTHQGRWLMHRLIIRPGPGLVVDHLNGNGLDNRRANLRVCTRAQNRANCRPRYDVACRFRGVVRITDTSFYAQIGQGGRTRRLGRFGSAEQAAHAYDAAAREAYGPFARLNFPLPGEQAVQVGGHQ